MENFNKGLRTTSTQDIEESDHTVVTSENEDLKELEEMESSFSHTLTSADDDGTSLPLSEPLQKFVAHVPDIPSQKDMEEKILRAKKMELLKQYASDQMIKQAEESKRILGYSDSTSSTGHD